MQIISLEIDFVLAGYVAGIVRLVPRCRQLRQAIANGDALARSCLYHQVLVFEWVSALLTILALGLTGAN
jgi:hypothetical protein